RPFLRRLGRIGSRVLTRAAENLHFSSCRSGNIADVRNFLGRGNQSDGLDAGVARVYIHRVSFRIVRTAGPVRPARGRSHGERSQRTFELAHRRGREDRAQVILRGNFFGAFAKRGGEIDQIIDGDAVAAVSGRLAGKRLRRRIRFAGNVADLHRLLGNGPDGFSGDAVENGG